MSEPVNIRELNDLIASRSNFLSMIRTGMQRRIVGQKHLIDSLLIALLANGHVLLEGVPSPCWSRSYRICRRLILSGM